MATMTLATQRARTLRRNLCAVGVMGAAGLTLSLTYRFAGVGLPCLFRELTGWWCPLCGGTRMAAAILDGDLVAAFWWNPVAFVLAGGLAVVVGAWVIEALGGPRLKWPTSVPKLSTNQVLALIAVIAVGWTLLRNLVLPS